MCIRGRRRNRKEVRVSVTYSLSGSGDFGIEVLKVAEGGSNRLIEVDYLSKEEKQVEKPLAHLSGDLQRLAVVVESQDDICSDCAPLDGGPQSVSNPDLGLVRRVYVASVVVELRRGRQYTLVLMLVLMLRMSVAATSLDERSRSIHERIGEMLREKVVFLLHAGLLRPLILVFIVIERMIPAEHRRCLPLVHRSSSFFIYPFA